MRSLHDLDAEIRATELRIAQRRQDLNRDLRASRVRTRRMLASPTMLLGAVATGFVIERLGRARPVWRSTPASNRGGRMMGLAVGLGAAAMRVAFSNPQLWWSVRALWEKRMAHRHASRTRHGVQEPYDLREDVRYPFAGWKAVDRASQVPSALRMLHEDHDHVDRLLGQLMAQEGDLDNVRRALQDQLERHMTAEEQVFYAALGRVEMLASFLSLLRDQHARLRESVAELVACELADRRRFRATTLHLKRLFDEHIEDEEGRGFAYAVEHLATDLDAIAAKLERRRIAAQGAHCVG